MNYSIKLLAGVTAGALLGVGIGVAAFIVQAKHDVEASY